jgi:hypothetical protein
VVQLPSLRAYVDPTNKNDLRALAEWPCVQTGRGSRINKARRTTPFDPVARAMMQAEERQFVFRAASKRCGVSLLADGNRR